MRTRWAIVVPVQLRGNCLLIEGWLKGGSFIGTFDHVVGQTVLLIDEIGVVFVVFGGNWATMIASMMASIHVLRSRPVSFL